VLQTRPSGYGSLAPTTAIPALGFPSLMRAPKNTTVDGEIPISALVSSQYENGGKDHRTGCRLRTNDLRDLVYFKAS
jgi:hypothetical protein